MNFEKHLLVNEMDSPDEFITGIKKWLNDFEKAYNYGNFKLAKSVIKNIKTQIDNMYKQL